MKMLSEFAILEEDEELGESGENDGKFKACMIVHLLKLS